MQSTPSIPSASVGQATVQQPPCRFADPRFIVSGFVAALEGGELSVFDREMTQIMLTPAG